MTAANVLAQYGGTSPSWRNRIINGAMGIDQRNAGASLSATTATFGVDRWQTYSSVNSKYTSQQNSGSVTPPAGFTNYLGVVSSSAYSSAAGDVFTLLHNIEGFNVADLGFGTASAKTVTLSFWVRSSLTGTFGGSLANNGYNTSYPFSYTISVANTWEQKSITIPGSVIGTWTTDNSAGIRLYIDLGSGSTYKGTAGTWASNIYTTLTGATSVVGTNGATFYITGVQLEVGSSATGFEYRQYQQELALCQRYYQRIQGSVSNQYSVGIGVVGSATQVFRVNSPIKVSFRAAPTLSASGLTAYDGSSNSAVSVNTGYTSTDQVSFDTSGGSGYTVGRAATVLTGASNTSYFDASAEL